jgi:hypothetical protein
MRSCMRGGIIRCFPHAHAPRQVGPGVQGLVLAPRQGSDSQLWQLTRLGKLVNKVRKTPSRPRSWANSSLF